MTQVNRTTIALLTLFAHIKNGTFQTCLCKFTALELIVFVFSAFTLTSDIWVFFLLFYSESI
jgi:hypothetical protein